MKIIGAIIVAVSLVFGLMCFSAWIGTLTWGVFAPTLGLPILGFWQMMCLFIFTGIAFKPTGVTQIQKQIKEKWGK